MRPLTAADILKVWERGVEQSAIDRALTTLAAACPELAQADLAALSIGQRDSRLFELRELTFGSRLHGFTVCGQCQERLVFALDLAAIRRRFSSAPSNEEFEFETDGRTFRFRLPNSRDLAAIAVSEEVATARRLLAERCVLQMNIDGVEQTSVCSTLSEEAVTKLAERMNECAPEAEVRLDLACPSCGHPGQAIFDIAAIFWAELSAQARRLLREVHLLASAYSWREADILAMSARRRQAYLEMIG